MATQTQEVSPPNKAAVMQKKNEYAIRLLQEWLADESGYDEKNWPLIKRAVEENKTSSRRRFSD